ncbi:hypothetical protein [uncultured Devosia sp.]|uniref:hypothetical protein n=1 Tax=uncultured Devosia sp. TaxID=211434 RepID=UPI0035CBD430
MKSIRLLPVVVLAISAMLVLKTLGLVTTGSYVLGGVGVAQAEEAAPEGDAATGLSEEPTMADTSPTLDDAAPTLGATEGGDHSAAPAEGEHGAEAPEGDHAAPAVTEGDPALSDAAHGEAAPEAGADHGAEEAGLAAGLELACPPSGTLPVAAPVEANAESPQPAEEGAHDTSLAAALTEPDCVPLTDAVPTQIGADGQPVPLVGEDGETASERALLERLSERRTELEAYEQDLTLRSAIVDAAEKKMAERQATLEALEAQISGLVDQRTEMESGQFATIVTLYENMKPKDAAIIFNSLDMEVLLRVAKSMNPRKMSPILAAMDPARAQELTVRMAALADQPAEQMTPADVAALPQIVGQ